MTIHVSQSDLRIAAFTALWQQLRGLVDVHPVLTGPLSRADVWHRIVTAATGLRAIYPEQKSVIADIRLLLETQPSLVPHRSADDCPDFLAIIEAEVVSDPLHEFMRDYSRNASRVLQHTA